MYYPPNTVLFNLNDCRIVFQLIKMEMAKKKVSYTLAVTPHAPVPHLLSMTNLFSVSMVLPIPDISYKWNHRVCGWAGKGYHIRLRFLNSAHSQERYIFRTGSWPAPGSWVLSPWNVQLDKSVFACWRPWDILYQIIYANNVIYGEHLFFALGVCSLNR